MPEVLDVLVDGQVELAAPVADEADATTPEPDPTPPPDPAAERAAEEARIANLEAGADEFEALSDEKRAQLLEYQPELYALLEGVVAKRKPAADPPS